MPIASGVRALMGVFGPLLQAGTQSGRGAQVMWQTFQDAYASLGIARPTVTLQDMNQFVVGLGRVIRASAALGAAPDDFALTSDYMAPPIASPSSPADYANPSMVATFQTFIDTEAGQITRWSSVAYNNVFPATVGQLRGEAIASVQSQLDIAAMDEGGDSPTAGGTVLGLGQMYVIARGVE